MDHIHCEFAIRIHYTGPKDFSKVSATSNGLRLLGGIRIDFQFFIEANLCAYGVLALSDA